VGALPPTRSQRGLQQQTETHPSVPGPNRGSYQTPCTWQTAAAPICRPYLSCVLLMQSVGAAAPYSVLLLCRFQRPAAAAWRSAQPRYNNCKDLQSTDA
jgi:hypothetical protein